MTSATVTEVLYLLAAPLFILALRWMSAPDTARRAVASAVTGMLLAIVGTLITPEIVTYNWIALAAVAGIALGIPLARVPLTAVPQRTALSHAFGGLAAGLVGTAKYYLWLVDRRAHALPHGRVAGEVILGFLTFTGSLMAAGKLQNGCRRARSPTRDRTRQFRPAARRGGPRRHARVRIPCSRGRFPVIVALALIFGVLLIMPIGGADMPTVISLLNSYAGLSAVAMGFVLENKLLITAGALDGSSGFDPVDHHVQGDEPLVHQRALRRVRPGADGEARRRAAQRSRARRRRTRRELLEQRRPRRDHPRLRHGRGAGAAPRARARTIS